MLHEFLYIIHYKTLLLLQILQEQRLWTLDTCNIVISSKFCSCTEQNEPEAMLHCIMYKLHLFNRLLLLIENSCIARRAEWEDSPKSLFCNIKNSFDFWEQTLGGTPWQK